MGIGVALAGAGRAACASTLASCVERDLEAASQESGQYLGGGLGGDAWLIRDAQGQLIVQKMPNSGKAGDEVLRTEAALFDSLHARAREGKNLGFRLPSVQRFSLPDGKMGLYVEYRPGLNAEQFLRSLQISASVKARVQANYLKAIEALSQSLGDPIGLTAAVGPETQDLPSFSMILDGRLLLIKSDNVIVDPQDLSLSLIDRY